MSLGRAAGIALVAGLALAGCSSGKDQGGGGASDTDVGQIAKDVLTGKGGTVSALKAKRGEGPFREYALRQDELFDVVEEVMRGRVAAVFPNRKAHEVVAKERCGKDEFDDWYSPDWITAVVVTVHPDLCDPRRSKLEIHWTHRGTFVRGSIDWERYLPPRIDEAVRRRLEGGGSGGGIRPL